MVSELAAHGKSTDPHWFHQICQETKQLSLTKAVKRHSKLLIT